MSGKIYESETKNIIKDAELKLYNSADSLLQTTKSDKNGNYSFDYLTNGKYKIRIEKKKFTPKMIINIPIKDDDLVVDINLGKYIKVGVVY